MEARTRVDGFDGVPDSGGVIGEGAAGAIGQINGIAITQELVVIGAINEAVAINIKV